MEIKGKYTILKRYCTTNINSNNKKTYRYITEIKCNDCGKIRKINEYAKNINWNICRNCKEQQIRNSIIGKENDIFKIIGLDDEYNNKTNKFGKRRHIHYLIQCKKCGKIFSRRASVIKESMLNSIQCSNCKHLRYNKPLDVIHYKAYCAYRSGAKARNIEWNLSEEDFKKLTLQNCYYCNCAPNRKQKVYYTYRENENINLNGIDRINSSKGYTIENCVPCCEQCNKMKLTYSTEEFLKKIKEIYDFSIKRSTTISKESTSQANGDGNGELLTAA